MIVSFKGGGGSEGLSVAITVSCPQPSTAPPGSAAAPELDVHPAPPSSAAVATVVVVVDSGSSNSSGLTNSSSSLQFCFKLCCACLDGRLVLAAPACTLSYVADSGTLWSDAKERR